MISLELRQNSGPRRGYRPFDARRRATVRRARQHQRRVDTNSEVGTLVGELLAHWQKVSVQLQLLDGCRRDVI